MTSVTDYSSFPPYKVVNIIRIGGHPWRILIVMKIVDYALGAALVIAVGAGTLPGTNIDVKNTLASSNFRSKKFNKQTEEI